MSENFRQLWDQLHDLDEVQDQSRNQQIPLFLNDDSAISKPQSSLHQSLILVEHRVERNTLSSDCNQIQTASRAKQIDQLKEVTTRLLDDNKKLFQECIKLRKLITKHQTDQLLLAPLIQYQNRIKLLEEKQMRYCEKIRQKEEIIKHYEEGQRIYRQKQVGYQQQIRQYQLSIARLQLQIRQYQQKDKITNSNSSNSNSNSTRLPPEKGTTHHQTQNPTSTHLSNHNNINSLQQNSYLQTLLKDKQRQITNIKVVHQAQVKNYKETIKELQKQIQCMNCM